MDFPLTRLTTPEVILALGDTIPDFFDKGTAPATVNAAIETYRSALEQARKEGIQPGGAAWQRIRSEGTTMLARVAKMLDDQAEHLEGMARERAAAALRPLQRQAEHPVEELRRQDFRQRFAKLDPSQRRLQFLSAAKHGTSPELIEAVLTEPRPPIPDKAWSTLVDEATRAEGEAWIVARREPKAPQQAFLAEYLRAKSRELRRIAETPVEMLEPSRR